jgi:hypothetical protein
METPRRNEAGTAAPMPSAVDDWGPCQSIVKAADTTGILARAPHAKGRALYDGSVCVPDGTRVLRTKRGVNKWVRRQPRMAPT